MQELAVAGCGNATNCPSDENSAHCPSVGDVAAVAAQAFAAEFGMRLQCGGLDALGDAAALLDG